MRNKPKPTEHITTEEEIAAARAFMGGFLGFRSPPEKSMSETVRDAKVASKSLLGSGKTCEIIGLATFQAVSKRLLLLKLNDLGARCYMVANGHTPESPKLARLWRPDQEGFVTRTETLIDFQKRTQCEGPVSHINAHTLIAKIFEGLGPDENILLMHDDKSLVIITRDYATPHLGSKAQQKNQCSPIQPKRVTRIPPRGQRDVIPDAPGPGKTSA